MAILYRNKILEEDLTGIGTMISSAFPWTTDETPKVDVIKSMIDTRLKYAMACGYSWNVSTPQMLEYKFKDFIYRYNQILIASTTKEAQGLVLKSFANPADKYSENRTLNRETTTSSEFNNESNASGTSDSENKTIEELSPVNNDELFDVSSPSTKENYKDNSSSTSESTVSGTRDGSENENTGETVTKDKQYFEYYYRAYKAMLNNANVMYLIDAFIKAIVYEMNAIW